MCLCDIEVQSGEEFAASVLQHLNGAAVALMLSVGHRTRLFDMLAALPAATSAELAEAAGLNERYVREWLSAMTTARIVSYDAERQRFTLPPLHAAFLTRAASPNNIAATAQFVPVLGAVEDRIVECFYRGGGVPYEAFGRFHNVMAEESA